ncbi:uncharacterized protein LOC118205232 [Stegodyphus dumicola]|uniref:uncharacterized protein LOC118205232 n=1 Tax=Stegodyphus dumicola TaxID=202533 RepID=UPI0015AB6F34|nr:uncharacterized protein LOC118205232 [Stegodyphus dumicola]
MPHQPVIRPDKPVRVVFDASSHSKNEYSLNDCLYSGPNLNPPLLEILIQFRTHGVAFTADIEQAFVQISLSPEDKDAVRFLWANNLTDKDGKPNMKRLRMTRVLFGATSSPFLLASTIKHHIDTFKETNQKAVKLLNKCLYVDDLIGGDEDENEVKLIYEDIRYILKASGFNMRKWETNCAICRKFLMNKKMVKSRKFWNRRYWDIKNYKEDLLKIESQNLTNQAQEETKLMTKREVLKTIGKLYDPIGFISPFTIRAKY